MSTIAVIGAGINGLSLAIALSKVGFKAKDITIYEKSPKARTEGTGIIFWSEVLSLLKLLDIDLNHLGVKLSSLKTIFLPEKDAPTEFNIKKENGEEAYGFLREKIHQVLTKKIKALNIKIKTGYECEKVEQNQDGCTIHFKNKESVSMDVVIGADGINSSVRHSVYPEINPQALDILAYRGLYQSDHQKIKASQLPLDACHLYCGVNWRIVFYPNQHLQDETHYYWFAAHRLSVEHQESASPSSYQISKKEIENLISNLPNCPPNMQKVLKNTELNNIIKSSTIKQMPIFDYAKGRIALLGDAAHAMAPTVALGFLLGIINVLHLASQMKKHKANLPRAFLEYQKIIKPHSKACLDYTSDLTHLYYAADPMSTLARAKKTYENLYALIREATLDSMNAYFKALGLDHEEIVYH